MFAKTNRSPKKEIYIVFWGEIITCDPSIHVMDHPDLTVSSFMENSIGRQRVKTVKFHTVLMILLLNYNSVFTYCVVTKPGNITFISCIEENWSTSVPVICVDQVALLESIQVHKAKVVYLKNHWAI